MSSRSEQVLATLSKEDLRRQVQNCYACHATGVDEPLAKRTLGDGAEAKDEEAANVIFAELARIKQALKFSSIVGVILC